MPELRSVAAGGDIQTQIDLGKLSQDLEVPSITYEPESFSGLHFQFTDDGPTITLFSNGKFSITGARDISGVESCFEELISILNGTMNAGISRQSASLNIRSLSYWHHYRHELDLENLEDIFDENEAEYDPDNHPALLYEPDERGLFMIFRSGKIGLVGIKRDVVAQELFDELLRRLPFET